MLLPLVLHTMKRLKKSTSIQTRRRGYCPHSGLVQFTNHIFQNQLHRPLTGRLLPPRTSTLAVFFWAARLLLLVFLSLVFREKGKVSPYSITERMVPQLILVLSSQPAGNVSHKPGGRLPLLSARPAVTLATLNRAATSFEAW